MSDFLTIFKDIGRDLLIFLFNIFGISIAISAISCFFIECIKIVKIKVFKLIKKMNNITIFFVNLFMLSLMDFLLVNIFYNKVDKRIFIIFYCISILIVSWIFSNLLYNFFIKNIVLIKDFFINKSKIKNFETQIKIEELKINLYKIKEEEIKTEQEIKLQHIKENGDKK